MANRKAAFEYNYADGTPTDDTSPEYVNKWFGIKDLGGPGAALTRLEGGLIGTDSHMYRPFPGSGFSDEPVQGELWNWKQPQIKGMYRNDKASSMDAMATLGMAANESKRKWGVEPLPDTSLSADSARVTAGLTGTPARTTYKAYEDKEGLRDYGNSTTQWLLNNAQAEVTRGSDKVRNLPESAIAEGTAAVRNKLRDTQAKQRAEETSRVEPTKQNVGNQFKQYALPGFE